MNHLHHYISYIVRQQGSSTHYELLRQWPEIMGNLYQQTRLESFSQGTLIIGVYDPQWMQELYMLSSEIKRHINSYFQSDVVHYIRFKRVARRTKRAMQSDTAKQQHRVETSTLSSHQRQKIDAIADAELRDVLYKFYTYSE